METKSAASVVCAPAKHNLATMPDEALMSVLERVRILEKINEPERNSAHALLGTE